MVKQTFRHELRPKPTFTRHNTILPSVPIPVAVHDSQTKLHGWEWYEMTVFVHWEPPRNTTLICSGLPQHLQASLQSALASAASTIDFCDPYSVFGVLLHEIVSLYDKSVWSIRDHICDWEAVRESLTEFSCVFLLLTSCRRDVKKSPTMGYSTKSQDMQSMLAKR